MNIIYIEKYYMNAKKVNWNKLINNDYIIIIYWNDEFVLLKTANFVCWVSLKRNLL